MTKESCYCEKLEELEALRAENDRLRNLNEERKWREEVDRQLLKVLAEPLKKLSASDYAAGAKAYGFQWKAGLLDGPAYAVAAFALAVAERNAFAKCLKLTGSNIPIDQLEELIPPLIPSQDAFAERLVSFEELAGKHLLSAVSQGTAKGTSDSITFKLDGVTYTALEDPDDGYRSCMEKLVTSRDIPDSIFPPAEVIGIAENDIICFLDTTTGKGVLSVGTDYTDNYYPSFVAMWKPQNLIHNRDK